ncbi:MAG: hypothetical protein GY820_32410 [Gammaproteobacteria bacterium]|nr:hypothetical protein [Gammaproteobacteria bacterium]
MYAYKARHIKKYAKSDGAYSKLIVLNPSQAKYRYGRGGLNYDWGKFSVAMEYFDKAYKLKPSSTLYLFWAALASVRSDYPKGLVLFREYLKRCKNEECNGDDLKWAEDWVFCVDGEPQCELDEHDYIKWQHEPLYSH